MPEPDSRPRAATPEIDAEIVRLLHAWQDSDVYIRFHALLQSNILSAALTCAGAAISQKSPGPPNPDVLRHDARDLLAAAWGFAYFMDGFADRIEAGMN